MKVCWLSEVTSPYKMKLLSLLAEHCELTVLLLESESQYRHSSWFQRDCGKARLIFLPKNATRILWEMAKTQDVLVDSVYYRPQGILAVQFFRMHGKKTVLHADGGKAQDRGFLMNHLISLVMKRHRYFSGSGEITDRYFLFYRVNPAKILHYRFTSLSAKAIEENCRMAEEKNEFRKKLGMREKYIFLSVGRPLACKGFDTLVRSFLKAGFPKTVGLWIVGGEPLPEVAELAKGAVNRNIHFVEALSEAEVRDYYAAADTFVFCSRCDIWGLVVQEALSFRLPVIVSDGCVAGEHFAKHVSAVTLLPCDDVAAFAEAMRHEKEKPSAFTEDAIHYLQEYSLENSCLDILHNLEKVVGV